MLSGKDSLRIDVHDNDDDNAWQRGPLWPHRMSTTRQTSSGYKQMGRPAEGLGRPGPALPLLWLFWRSVRQCSPDPTGWRDVVKRRCLRSPRASCGRPFAGRRWQPHPRCTAELSETAPEETLPAVPLQLRIPSAKRRRWHPTNHCHMMQVYTTTSNNNNNIPFNSVKS